MCSTSIIGHGLIKLSWYVIYMALGHARGMGWYRCILYLVVRMSLYDYNGFFLDRSLVGNGLHTCRFRTLLLCLLVRHILTHWNTHLHGSAHLAHMHNISESHALTLTTLICIILSYYTLLALDKDLNFLHVRFSTHIIHLHEMLP